MNLGRDRNFRQHLPLEAGLCWGMPAGPIQLPGWQRQQPQPGGAHLARVLVESLLHGDAILDSHIPAWRRCEQ